MSARASAPPQAGAIKPGEQVGLFDLQAPAPEPTATKPRRGAKNAPDPNPTGQQAAVVAAFVAGKDLVIEAGAGAGKTSTLRMCANADKRRGVYIVFGKANADEAKRKFPANVVAKTAHGFAMADVGGPYRHRLGSAKRLPPYLAAQALGINEPLFLGSDLPPLSPKTLASLAMDAIRRFTRSADIEVDLHHVPKVNGFDKPAIHGALASIIAPIARKAWADIVNPNGRLRFEHDHYLKIWALTDPQFDADYVLLDEAQDADPSIASVVNGQRSAQRIMVGDQCQSIYGWRGAVNAMRGFAGQRLTLSQSFRFGPAVADEANKWLRILDSDLRLTGYEAIASRVDKLDAPEAVLCRTNAEAINEAGRAIDAGRRVALVKGGAAIRKLAEAARDLQEGRGTDHPELLAFSSWDEVRSYVQQEEDGADLRSLVSLIDDRGAEGVIELVDQLVDERRADTVVSTAHKAKGREWKTVRIADDFPEPKAKPDEEKKPTISSESAMLAYVAVTRAQVVLDRGGLSWVDKW
jgi:hypothetical protein